MSESGPARPSAVVIEALERQLRVAQQITHIGSWEWDAATNVVTWSDELYRIYGIEPGTPITFDGFLSHVHPDDRDRVRGEIGAALGRGGPFGHSERILHPDGSVRELDSRGEVTLDANGKATGLIGTCRDVTAERARERSLTVVRKLQASERHALEILAAGAPLRDVLTTIVLGIEDVAPDTLASLLMLDDKGGRFTRCIAPSLPVGFNRALEGSAIGPAAGSCGTAAFRRESVYVASIETDPLWTAYRALVEPHGLRACWSSPIFANDGRVLGTFAIYYRECRMPTAEERELIDRATHVAGIAIERRQLDNQLRALSSRIEAVREEDRTVIAREIHDELGQALTALKMDIAWVARRLDGDPTVGTKLTEISGAADSLIQSIRRIAAELRPGILDDLGLVAAIEWQAEEFTKRSGIPCVLSSTLGEMRLDRTLATGVFRVFQESLTNVVRHANAKRVDVRLALDRGRLILEVADDGVGFRPTSPRDSLGLLGMRERARGLDGSCEVRQRDGGGTIVTLGVPLRFQSRVLDDGVA